MAPRLVTRDDLNETTKDAMRKYRTLLSLDGGGMRGVISAQVLKKLEVVIAKVLFEDKLLKEEVAKDISSPADIAVDLADWFDALSGTSTGGLLTLYFASKGGCDKAVGLGGARKGSAASAENLYLKHGMEIFPKNTTPWVGGLITSVWGTASTLYNGGKFQYDGKGLQKVLQTIFGDLTMKDLKKTTVITSTDIVRARSAVFAYKDEDTQEWRDPNDPSGPVFLVPRRFADADVARAHPQLYGTLYRKPIKPELTYDSTRSRPIADMSLHSIEVLPRNKTPEPGSWLTPVQAEALNFKVTDVARATSAAPSFLPPWSFSPVNLEAPLPRPWPITFVDGGLANNDPAWMGLSVLLMTDPQGKSATDYGVANHAVLSIGCGQQMSTSSYNSLGGPNITGTLSFIGDIISATMSINGEDKENILSMLFYGLLCLPKDQYLRIQLRLENSNSVDGESSNTSTSLTPEQIKALNSIDDASAPTLQVYQQLGQQLVSKYEQRLEDWVRNYIF